jgi:hypothetical protein
MQVVCWRILHFFRFRVTSGLSWYSIPHRRLFVFEPRLAEGRHRVNLGLAYGSSLHRQIMTSPSAREQVTENATSVVFVSRCVH